MDCSEEPSEIRERLEDAITLYRNMGYFNFLNDSCSSGGYASQHITNIQTAGLDIASFQQLESKIAGPTVSSQVSELRLLLSPYPYDQPQNIGTSCAFFLHILSTHGNPINQRSLDCYVIGPSGCRYDVQLVSNAATINLCVFRPLEVGLHTAIALTIGPLFPNLQVYLTVNIDRNYRILPSNPIVAFDIELPFGSERVIRRKPWGLCCNTKTEQILVTDRLQHEILVYRPDGDFHFRFGSRGNEPGQFCRPAGIAYDAVRDCVLVADKDNHRIQILSSNGDFVQSFGSFGRLRGQFKYPWGIAVSRDGQFIAVADSRNARIQLFDADGRYIRMFSHGQEKFGTHLKTPRGITFDLKGDNLFVTDYGESAVFQVDISRGSCTLLVDIGVVNRPSGVAMDNSGNLLICDTCRHSLMIFDPTSGILQQVVRQLGDSGQLHLPLDITILRAHFVAVLDCNGRIRVV